MNSENIDQLITALAKAQGGKDFERESKLIPLILNKKHTTDPRKKNIVNRFFTKLSFGSSECWYWDGCIDDVGYGRLGKYDGENKAHRISWKLFNGEIPDGMKILHKCDIKNCVNPDHLFLGTQQDNIKDMVLKGRDKFGTGCAGEKNPMSRLTEKKVLSMREKYSMGGISYKSIAKLFNVSTMTAYRAITKRLWRNV